MALCGVFGDKSSVLVDASLARAQFYERTGPMAGLDGRQLALFLMGPLSLVDAMLDPLAPRDNFNHTPV